MVLIELLIVVAGVIIVILVAVAILANPNGPPVAGACGLVRRTIKKDYCSGTCPPGQVCVVTATRPWAGGIGGATQAAACGCAVAVAVLPPPGSLQPGSGGEAHTDGVAPINGGTHR
jgi:hypothetical protein